MIGFFGCFSAGRFFTLFGDSVNVKDMKDVAIPSTRTEVVTSFDREYNLYVSHAGHHRELAKEHFTKPKMVEFHLRECAKWARKASAMGKKKK